MHQTSMTPVSQILLWIAPITACWLRHPWKTGNVQELGAGLRWSQSGNPGSSGTPYLHRQERRERESKRTPTYRQKTNQTSSIHTNVSARPMHKAESLPQWPGFKSDLFYGSQHHISLSLPRVLPLSDVQSIKGKKYPKNIWKQMGTITGCSF